MMRWMVFGRREYAEPLRQEGVVEAVEDSEASETAVETYGRDWVEMVLVPESAIRWVLGEAEGKRSEPSDAARLG
jgi:1,2-phenylacetyl-CoA epoxidase PaaB subunit